MAHHEKALHLQFQLLILNRDKGENILILSYQLPLEKKNVTLQKEWNTLGCSPGTFEGTATAHIK